MARRGSDNQQRFEDAARRLFQRGAGNNQPDVTRYQVMIDGEDFFLGERRIEIIDGKTVATYKSQLSDSGVAAFSHIKEILKCSSCGCKLNIKVEKVYRCFFCRKTVCSAHSVRWNSKNISFCRKNIKCLIMGRLLQLGYYNFKFIKFSCCQILGIESKPDRASLPDGRRGIEGEGEEIVVVDEGDIDRQVERYKELNKGGDNYLI